MGIVEDIQSIKIQGARAIAYESLKHLEKFSSEHGFGKEFEMEAKRLVAARPTAVSLHNVLEILMKSRSRETIHVLIDRLDSDERAIGFHGRKLIKNGFRVHTRCHSSEAFSIIREAARQNKFTVLVDETRPLNQGFITAKEMSELRNVTVSLGVDAAAGISLSGQGVKKDDIVIVGADAIRREGFYNKIGTYMLALVAKENSIPFYVAASTMKIDRRRRIEIEQRSAEEVSHSLDKKIEIRNPAFDITPWKYVTGVVTEKGIMKPEKIVKMI